MYKYIQNIDFIHDSKEKLRDMRMKISYHHQK